MTDQGPGAEHGILDNLPAKRPQRRSAKRDAPVKARAPKRSAKSEAPLRPQERSSAGPRRSAREQAKRTGGASQARGEAASRPAGPPAPVPGASVDPPTNSELLGSAAAAVTEIASIGLRLTEQLLRAATRRIPKP